MTLKVLLDVPLSPFTGYGNDGIGMARALLRMGADVYAQPRHVDPPLPEGVARVLTKGLRAPFDVVIVHVDPMNQGLRNNARKASNVAVGWTMWEFSTVDNMKYRGSLRKRTSDLDLMLAYDPVTEGALNGANLKCPVEVLQGGFAAEDWKPVARDYSKNFRFCMVGQLGARKDPYVAIQAFRELKEELGPDFEDAELHLKTNEPSLHPLLERTCPKLRIHLAVWPQEVMAQFYSSMHVLLAPSRGEGKNVPALEFMATGGTVIATNWGGHTMWMNKDYAYPLDYVLRPETGYDKCFNARASKDHLKELMVHAYRNRGEVAEKGRIAARTIPNMCSWDSVMKRFFERVNLALSTDGSREMFTQYSALRPAQVDRTRHREPELVL